MRILFGIYLYAITSQIIAAPSFTKEQQPPTFDGVSLTDPGKLCDLAQEVQAYRDGGLSFDSNANHIGPLSSLGYPADSIQKTLSKICEISLEDKQLQQPSRLADSQFLAENFEWIRWQPDMEAAAKIAPSKSLVAKLPDNKILMTKYYVRRIDSSEQQQSTHPYALYKIPHDEASLTIQQAYQQKDKLTRYSYGKQYILSGVLSIKQLASPLAWVSRQDLEAALMQGTAVSEDESGTRYFNVHRNNGIGYVRTQKPEQQQRYWYFREVDGIYGYGKDIGDKVLVQPEMTLAGDVKFFGLGQLFMLSYRRNDTKKPQYRLAIMGDTGGAFVNNQFQIDLLTGYYRNWAEYHRANKHTADYVDAWILVAK